MSLILDGTNGVSDIDGTAATPAIRGTDTNTGIFFPAADTIAFSEGGTESARFDANGRLGIGTSSPTRQLSVVDSTNTTDYQLRLGQSNNSGNNSYDIGRNTSSTGYLTFYGNQNNGNGFEFSGVNGIRMTIDPSGRVITPSQPAFSAYSTANFLGTGQTPIQFSVTDFNIGSNYNTSTYRFTAPVAGRYLFTTAVSFYLNGNCRQIAIALRKNGSTYANADTFIAGVQSNNTHAVVNISMVMELAVNDYADVSWDFATASVNFYSDNKRCHFTGYLLG